MGKGKKGSGQEHIRTSLNYNVTTFKGEQRRY